MFEKLSSRFLHKGDKFKAVSKIKTNEFNVPMVYAKSGDNGIMYWSKQGDFETHKNVISIIYNGAIATGLVYAQPYDTGILAESYLIKIRNQEVSFATNLFLKTVLEKVLYAIYSRDYLATWANKAESNIISLPVKNNQPDYDYMETYIKAVQKLVIKDVVDFAERELKAYQRIIEK